MALTSTWENTELPVLEAIAHLFESEQAGMSIQLDDVIRVVDWDEDTVARAIKKLSHEHLVVQSIESSGGPTDYIIKDITPKGLRAAGLWPSEDAAAVAFMKALDQQIEESPEGSSKQSALESIKSSAKNVTEGTLTAVITAAVKGAAGL